MKMNVGVGHFFTNIGEKHEVGTIFICVGEKMFGWETFLKRVRSYCTLEQHFFSFQHKYLLQYSKG